MRSWASSSEAQTERVGEALAQACAGQGILLLAGDLGSGKTVLVRGLARALGVDPREIQSPTYTLIHEHDAVSLDAVSSPSDLPPGTVGRLVHVDLYRLEPEDVESLGLEELLAGPGVKAIEWPDRLPDEPPGAWHVEIRRTGETSREITVRELDTEDS